MVKEQKYSVVNSFAGFELRNYEPCVLADIEITSNFEKAGNAGFGPLVGYIGGQNQPGTKISMTSPVIQEPAGTAHIVSFVLPSEIDEPGAPKPTDNRVALRFKPQELVAVARFTGLWSAASYQERLTKLLAAIDAAGYRTAGNARFARFDPPWTPWFMRRNEIQIPVAPVA
ncbi:MAG: hypothetical protein RL741_1303 [Actinomycetota bacterium]|jgi:hypothetical protein